MHVIKDEAKECTEFFISGESDISTEEEKKQYDFEIVRIKPVRNDAFEVEELTEDEKQSIWKMKASPPEKAYLTEIKTDICLGDCLEVLPPFPDESFDLIVTSPPYADSRSKTYGGIKPDDYVDWFLPRSKEFLRVLKKDGTFILNVKENRMQNRQNQ